MLPHPAYNLPHCWGVLKQLMQAIHEPFKLMPAGLPPLQPPESKAPVKKLQTQLHRVDPCSKRLWLSILLIGSAPLLLRAPSPKSWRCSLKAGTLCWICNRFSFSNFKFF